jgi:long-chain acyl-CoA synthetase
LEKEAIGSVFQERVEKFGDREFLRYKEGGQWISISWNQANENVKNFSLGMIALGLEDNENVALFSENRPHWIFADLAILSAKAVNVPIYATNTPAQAEYIISDSESRIVIVSTPNQLEKVLSVKDKLPNMKNIIIFDPDGKPDPMVISYDEVLQMGRDYADQGEFERRLAAVSPDDLSSIVYTSGTTGDPKGAMLTHDNFLSNVRSTRQAVEVGDNDLCLSFLPLSHVLERMAGYYTTMCSGSTIAFAESIDKVRDNLSEVKPTIMVSVPRLYEKMYAGVIANAEAGSGLKKSIFYWSLGIGKRLAQYKIMKHPAPAFLKLKFAIANKLVFSKLNTLLGGRLRFFVSGGAPLSQEIAEFFYSAGILICEGYGLTETSPVITCNTPDNFKFGSVGRVITEVEAKIADDGEILCRGPNVMKGYFKKPEATQEVMSDDWFHTGDIGFFDGDGYLHITDRKKDIIVTSGGKNVAPQNIENMLKLNKYIEQIAVVGEQRKYLTALIVPSFPDLEEWAKGENISFSSHEDLAKNDKVIEFIGQEIKNLSDELASYEQIKKFVIIPEEFTQETGELTPTLKVKRKVLNAKFKDLIDKMYEDA